MRQMLGLNRRLAISDRLLVGKWVRKECHLEVEAFLRLSAVYQPLAWLTAGEWYCPEAEGFHLLLGFCRLLVCPELGLRHEPPLRGHHRPLVAVVVCCHQAGANLRPQQRLPRQQVSVVSFAPEPAEVSGSSWGRAFALLF